MATFAIKNMQWIGKPARFSRTWHSVKLTVDGNTAWPDGPTFVQATDLELKYEAQMNVPSEEGEAGIYLIQTPASYAGIGASRNGFHLHYSLQGYTFDSFIPAELPGNIKMGCEKRDNIITITWREGEKEACRQVASLTLPGTASSWSAGFYWANNSDKPFNAWVDRLFLTDTTTPNK